MLRRPASTVEFYRHKSSVKICDIDQHRTSSASVYSLGSLVRNPTIHVFDIIGSRQYCVCRNCTE